MNLSDTENKQQLALVLSIQKQTSIEGEQGRHQERREERREERERTRLTHGERIRREQDSI